MIVNIQYNSNGEMVFDGSENFDSKPLITVMDEVSDTVLYIGKAPVGTLTSDPSWKVIKMVTTGTVTRQYLAHGNSYYDNIWDDRLTLTYL